MPDLGYRNRRYCRVGRLRVVLVVIHDRAFVQPASRKITGQHCCSLFRNGIVRRCYCRFCRGRGRGRAWAEESRIKALFSRDAMQKTRGQAQEVVQQPGIKSKKTGSLDLQGCQPGQEFKGPESIRPLTANESSHNKILPLHRCDTPHLPSLHPFPYGHCSGLHF